MFVSPDTGLAQPRDLYSISGVCADLPHDFPLVVFTFPLLTFAAAVEGLSSYFVFATIVGESACVHENTPARSGTIGRRLDLRSQWDPLLRVLPACRWYAPRVVALRVEQHIIQRMTVRFLSQSVDGGVIVGVPVDAIGDVLVVRSRRLFFL